MRENAHETTNEGHNMIMQAIATIAGSIALIASPVVANDDNAATTETTLQEMHACEQDLTKTYHEVTNCLYGVYKDHRFDDTMPECEWEDSTNCIWMQIDGFGKTFIDVDGMAFYMTRIETHNV